MSALTSISDHLVDLLPRLSRTSAFVDDAAQARQVPHWQLAKNATSQAEELANIALELAGNGQMGLAKLIGHDGHDIALKAGALHSMSESQVWLKPDWQGNFQGAVNHVEQAIRQLT